MPSALDGKAAVSAAVIAGAVFLLLELVLVATIGGGSMWGPPRMIAAIALGEGVLPPPATFDLGILLAAMAVHFPLSILYGLLLGWAVSNWRMSGSVALVAGLIFGLGVYVVNFYGFTAVFPWFAMARNGISILAHAIYGVVLGWSYHRLASASRAHA